MLPNQLTVWTYLDIFLKLLYLSLPTAPAISQLALLSQEEPSHMCPHVSNRQRNDKAAAEVWTCRCPSLSRLLQQRVEGSCQHILQVTSADSGEQENWKDQSVLSSTEVWLQQSKHNVPGEETKQNYEESF